MRRSYSVPGPLRVFQYYYCVSSVGRVGALRPRRPAHGARVRRRSDRTLRVVYGHAGRKEIWRSLSASVVRRRRFSGRRITCRAVPDYGGVGQRREDGRVSHTPVLTGNGRGSRRR